MKNHLYLFLLLLPLFSYSQDSQKAKEIQTQAQELFDNGTTEAANELWIKAANGFETAGNWDEFAACGVSYTSSLIENKKLTLALTSTKDFIKKTEARNYNGINLSLLYKNLGKIYYRQYQNRQSLTALKKALELREAINPSDPELAKDYSNIGVLSNIGGRYNQAIKYLEKALELQQDNLVLANISTQIGESYSRIGNYRKGLDYQEQAIDLLKKESAPKVLAVALLTKGAILTQLKRNGADRDIIYKALKLFKQEEDRYNEMSCHLALADSYFQFTLGDYIPAWGLDSAEAHYVRGLEIAQQYIPNDLLSQSTITNSLVQLYTTKKNLPQATQYLAKSEELGMEVFEEKSIEAAGFYASKSDIDFISGQYDDAITDIHMDLISLLPDYSDEDPYKNPTIDIIKNNLSDDIITDALATKARILYKVYKKTNDDKKLDAAFSTITLLDDMINHIRTDFANSGSNIAWSDLTLDAYENAIEICLALAEAKKDDSYKEKAFYYSEKSKGLTLLEAFQNTKANKIAGIDLENELSLKLDISDLNQEIFQLKQEGAVNEEEIKALEKELFLKKEQYNTMIEEIERNHPEYFDAKYKLEILDVAAVRQLLEPNQGLLEYFVGDSAIYAFKVTKDDFQITKLKGQEGLGEMVYRFRENIYGYFLNNKSRDQQIKAKYAEQYTTYAHRLYKLLVAPLGQLPQKLIIIPAGAMCDMPFESLITSKVEGEHQQFKTHPYFVKDHIISYAYSATLLKEMQAKIHEKVEGTYLGFAPSFGEGSKSLIRGVEYSLSPLMYNSVEIENIQSLLGEGDIFTAEAATEDKFKELATNYSIIHFATHGLANNQDPDYSLLAFTNIDDDKENEFLYVQDMYNMQLNADMVVLSACETALGKNFRGEGIMSLARGFSYAGAKSIFTTLWSVNDQATFQIVERFYKNLQDGMSKDKALQQAKISFIDDGNDMTAHPFLWSPYIMLGDMTPIAQIQRSLPWTWIIGGVLGVVMIGLGITRFRGNKTA